MNIDNRIKELNERQKNICEYGAVFGVLITLTCLIQHLLVVIPSNITNPMIPAYTFSLAGFLLLGLQKRIAMVWLIISAVLSLIIEWRWMTHYSFSLMVLVLFLYHVVIIVFLFTEQIPERLKQIREAKEAEQRYWQDKM